MFGNVIKHNLSCLIFCFNTVLEHSYLLGRESLVCSRCWPHSPLLLSVGSGTAINVALWIRLWLFRCISLCALSSFLYLRKALKQPTVDEGFYFFASNSNLPHTMFQYLRSSRLLFSISGLNFISNFLVAATFNNFSVSPIYSFTAFD